MPSRVDTRPSERRTYRGIASPSVCSFPPHGQPAYGKADSSILAALYVKAPRSSPLIAFSPGAELRRTGMRGLEVRAGTCRYRGFPLQRIRLCAGQHPVRGLLEERGTTWRARSVDYHGWGMRNAWACRATPDPTFQVIGRTWCSATESVRKTIIHPWEGGLGPHLRTYVRGTWRAPSLPAAFGHGCPCREAASRSRSVPQGASRLVADVRGIRLGDSTRVIPSSLFVWQDTLARGALACRPAWTIPIRKRRKKKKLYQHAAVVGR